MRLGNGFGWVMVLAALALAACGQDLPAGDAVATLFGGSHLARAGDTLYASGWPPSIVSVSTDGFPPVLFADHQAPIELLTDDSNLYWGNSGITYGGVTNVGALMAAPLHGGTARELAPGPKPTGIALLNGYLYWSTVDYTQQEGPATQGSIRRVPISGGPAEIVTQGLIPRGIASDGDNVYFLEDTGEPLAKGIYKLSTPPTWSSILDSPGSASTRPSTASSTDAALAAAPWG